MSIDNIKNIRSADNNETVQNKAKNGSSQNDFLNLLHEFVEQNKTVSTNISKAEKACDRIQNNANYSSYNQLKVNHIDRQTANSVLVERILGGSNEEDRQSKIEMAKSRIASGFYFRDDIISETAGKIIDSVIR